MLVGHDSGLLIVRFLCERLSEQEVLGIQADDPVRNGSITRLLLRSGSGWLLTGYNDVRHLSDQGVEITEIAESLMTAGTEEVTPALLRDWSPKTAEAPSTSEAVSS